MPKPRPIPHLSKSDSFVQAAGRTVLTRAAEVAGTLPRALDRSDREGLHDLRVGLRRLRAAMHAYRAAFAPGAWELLQGEVRALFTPTTELRDVDVQTGHLEGLLAQAPPLAHAGIRLLLEDLARRHEDAAAETERALRAFETQDVLARLAAVVEASTGVTAAAQGVADELAPHPGVRTGPAVDETAAARELVP